MATRFNPRFVLDGNGSRFGDVYRCLEILHPPSPKYGSFFLPGLRDEQCFPWWQLSSLDQQKSHWDCREVKKRFLEAPLPLPVGGLEHVLFSIIYGIILPNRRTHIFQRGRYTTNQNYFATLPTCSLQYL